MRLDKFKLIIVVFIIAILVKFVLYDMFIESENLVVIGQYCNECGKLNAWRCGNCENCGYCVTEKGVGSCVEGDEHGPFFREDCVEWYPPGTMIYSQPIYVYGHGYNPTYNYNSWKFRRHRTDRSNRHSPRRH